MFGCVCDVPWLSIMCRTFSLGVGTSTPASFPCCFFLAGGALVRGEGEGMGIGSGRKVLGWGRGGGDRRLGGWGEVEGGQINNSGLSMVSGLV